MRIVGRDLCLDAPSSLSGLYVLFFDERGLGHGLDVGTVGIDLTIESHWEVWDHVPYHFDGGLLSHRRTPVGELSRLLIPGVTASCG